MITVKEAHERIAVSVKKLPVEEKPLNSAQGQVLAEDICAGFQLPRFDNAAMDGFAVQWEDIRDASQEHPAVLKVTEEIAAGAQPGLPVAAGSCAQIMTGAPMPKGADTVVIFEHTSGFGGSEVKVFKAPEFCANVRYAGEEVRPGEVLLKRGERLTPAELGVLAAFGRSVVPVYRRPRIGIITVGDELRSPGERLEGAAIYNSNGYSLGSCAIAAGAQISGQWQVPDDVAVIREALVEALSASDLLVTAGGISTGEYDYMQELLTGFGIEQEFWKVVQKPGKPFFFGKGDDGKMVFGLPGNPVSALVCFLEYCMPTLSAMQNSGYHGKIEAELVEPFPADKKRYRFLFGRIWQKKGRLFCKVSPKIESHMITSLVGANCLIEAPASLQPLSAGNAVTCNVLPWSSLDE